MGMQLEVGKWGNSLALRLPAALSKQAGIREGSRVDAKVLAGRELRLSRIAAPRSTTKTRAQLVQDMQTMQQAFPMGVPVVRWMRDQSF